MIIQKVHRCICPLSIKITFYCRSTVQTSIQKLQLCQRENMTLIDIQIGLKVNSIKILLAIEKKIFDNPNAPKLRPKKLHFGYKYNIAAV